MAGKVDAGLRENRSIQPRSGGEPVHPSIQTAGSIPDSGGDCADDAGSQELAIEGVTGHQFSGGASLRWGQSGSYLPGGALNRSTAG
jgi:hypothetical protein